MSPLLPPHLGADLRHVSGLAPLTACRFENAVIWAASSTGPPLMLQARASAPDHRATGLNCRTWSTGSYPRKWHPRVICSLPITGCWGFPSLSFLSLVSRLFFHVKIIHFVSCAAEGFWWETRVLDQPMLTSTMPVSSQ